jgi:hypothetical protein
MKAVLSTSLWSNMQTHVSSSTSASRILFIQASTHQSSRHFLHHRRSKAMGRSHIFPIFGNLRMPYFLERNRQDRSSLDCFIRRRKNFLKLSKKNRWGARREGNTDENDSDPIEFPLYHYIAEVSYLRQFKLIRQSSQLFLILMLELYVLCV